MIIMSCPRMEYFSAGESQTPKLENVKWMIDENQGLWKGDLNATIQDLFAKKVGFSTLEYLKLSEFPELIPIWNQKPEEILHFNMLISLEVSDVHSLKYLLTSSMALDLGKLQELKVKNCDTMEQVIASEEGSQEMIFSKMENLWLENLPKLTSFCSRNSATFEEAIISQPLFDAKVEFLKLKRLVIKIMESLNMIWDSQLDEDSFSQLNHLNVDSCEKLLHIFPFSMMERLKRLYTVEIWNCDLVEKIFESQGQYTSQSQANQRSSVETPMKFVFLNLTNLYLRNLPNLKCFFPQELNNLHGLGSFCSSNCEFGFPSLEDVVIMSCPRMEYFSMGESQTPKLQNVKTIVMVDENQGLWKGDLNATVQELFAQKVGYSTLEYLKLVEFPELIAIWNKTPQDILSGRILKHLEVCNINLLRYLFTSTMALELVQLEVLRVTHCEMMEEVVIEDGSQEIMFPELKVLLLEDLPKLARFYSEHYVKFPSLCELVIQRCDLLKTFISSTEKDKDTHLLALFDTKVTLPKLEVLIIDSMGSLNKIWEDQLEADAFCELRKFLVESCGKLLNIFPCSMLERLQKLDTLWIRNCNSLEEIFEYQGHGASAEQTVVGGMESTFLFSNLTDLKLDMLPKLKCVFPQVHTVEFPLLEELEVNGCYTVQTFASAFPSFQSRLGDDRREVSIQCPLFWVTEGTFPSLIILKLGWDNDITMEVWGGQDPGSYFPKLKRAVLIDFPEQSAQLPLYFFQSLPHFSELGVAKTREISKQEDNASSSKQEGAGHVGGSNQP